MIDLETLYSYNEWANARIFAALEAISEEAFIRPLGGSFSSIRDTLSHIIATEAIWLQRWQGTSPKEDPEWSREPSLTTLKDKLSHIESERKAFLSRLSPADLDQTISHRNLKGDAFSDPLRGLLFHLANHSTYHRGQIVTLLRQIGATPPALDFLIQMRENTHS